MTMEPTTYTDYELFEDGKQVLFEVTNSDGHPMMSSSLQDETEAKSYVKPGQTLYKRTTVTTYEAA